MKCFHEKTLKIAKWGCSRHEKISRFMTILNIFKRITNGNAQSKNFKKN